MKKPIILSWEFMFRQNLPLLLSENSSCEWNKIPEKRKTSVARYTLIFEKVYVSFNFSSPKCFVFRKFSFDLVQLALSGNFPTKFPQHLAPTGAVADPTGISSFSPK